MDKSIAYVSKGILDQPHFFVLCVAAEALQVAAILDCRWPGMSRPQPLRSILQRSKKETA